MHPRVPSGRVILPGVALRLSTAHDPVIEPGVSLLRSPRARRVGPDGPKVWRSPGVPAREPRRLRCVAKCSVASELPQSPKASLGPALAALRRAAAANKSARLAARLVSLADPRGPQALRSSLPMSVHEETFVPVRPGPPWVALSEATAAIVRALAMPQPGQRAQPPCHPGQDD